MKIRMLLILVPLVFSALTTISIFPKAANAQPLTLVQSGPLFSSFAPSYANIGFLPDGWGNWSSTITTHIGVENAEQLYGPIYRVVNSDGDFWSGVGIIDYSSLENATYYVEIGMAYNATGGYAQIYETWLNWNNTSPITYVTGPVPFNTSYSLEVLRTSRQGDYSYWTYYINGKPTNVGAEQYNLSSGAAISEFEVNDSYHPFTGYQGTHLIDHTSMYETDDDVNWEGWNNMFTTEMTRPEGYFNVAATYSLGYGAYFEAYIAWTWRYITQDFIMKTQACAEYGGSSGWCYVPNGTIEPYFKVEDIYPWNSTFPCLQIDLDGDVVGSGTYDGISNYPDGAINMGDIVALENAFGTTESRLL